MIPSNKIRIKIILYIIIFQIIVINCQEYVTLGRAFHTATLVGGKIYFLGGYINGDDTNHFFRLDISKSFVSELPDKDKILPFEDLTNLTLDSIPSHNRATTSVGGPSNESIFLFGGNMEGDYYSFDTIEERWRFVTVIQDVEPLRKTSMNAATDIYGKVYLFGGAKENTGQIITYFNDMNTFDTINKIWDVPLIKSSVPNPRDGYTATYIPNSGEIFYIGGFGNFGLVEISNIDIYDTIESEWTIRQTVGSPKNRVFHTAVLTSESDRIIIFGGADNTTVQPVKSRSRYTVLDVNTFEWYHGIDDVSTNVPFRGHTATLFKDQEGIDHMLIAFGMVHKPKPDDPKNYILSSDVIIYRIGDYANFTEVYLVEQDQLPPTPSTTPTPIPTTPSNNDNIKIVAIATTASLVVLGIALLVIYKKVPKIKTLIRGNVIPTP